MKKPILTLCLLSLICFSLSAQDFVRRSYTTARVQSQPPTIDGIIDENEWAGVEWGENFTVHNPNNGDAPQRQSKFKIL